MYLPKTETDAYSARTSSRQQLKPIKIMAHKTKKNKLDVVLEGKALAAFLKEARKQDSVHEYIRKKLTDHVDLDNGRVVYVYGTVQFHNNSIRYSEAQWKRIAADRDLILEALGIAKEDSILRRVHRSTVYPQFYHDFRVGGGTTWLYDRNAGYLEPRVPRELTEEDVKGADGVPLQEAIKTWAERGYEWTGRSYLPYCLR